MLNIFGRGTLLYYKFRQCHKNTLTSVSLSTFNMNEEKKAFQAVFPEIVNSLIAGPNLKQQPEMGTRVKQLLEYTVTGGKLARGTGISIGYRMLEDPKNYSEETQHLARIVGWCLEMFQAFMLIVDDVIDGASTRRGKPCWNRLPNVGYSAINDSILLYQLMLEVLEIKFGNAPFYLDLIRLFNQALCKVTIGEHLDCAWDYKKGKNNLDPFTLENVKTIAIHKTYYSFRFPILLVLLLVKNGKERDSKALNDICLDLGIYLQCQDDFKDAYGKELDTGKKGRDIQEGKCSWVSAAALKHCNDAQRSIFAEFYGSENPEHVKRIKQLYNELNIPQIYEQSQRNLYDDLVRRIHALPTAGQTKLFLGILEYCNF